MARRMRTSTSSCISMGETMPEVITPGAGILFMKIGTHAGEDLKKIIARKTKEIEETGYAMWGYGGNTCHPQTMVQPFVEMFKDRGKPIFLCMHEMQSNHFAEPLRANEYSADGAKWEKVPATINVVGSRFALVIKGLEESQFKLPLEYTRVPIGRSTGQIGSRYIRGHVDKACLEITALPERADTDADTAVAINLVAELGPPYAVFLRNHR